MAFREKITWSSLLITLAVWGWYFASFVTGLRNGRFDQGAAVGSFIQAVALIVIVQVAASILLAVSSGRQAAAPADDRERAIALSAYRPAYFVLSGCVVTLMVLGPVLLRIADDWTPAPPADMAPVLLGNALLASLVLAELVHGAWQLFRYRRGG